MSLNLEQMITNKDDQKVTQKLTYEDRKKLYGEFLPLLLFIFFATGLFYCIYTFVLKEQLNTDSNLKYLPFLFFGFIGLCFIAVFVYIAFSMIADLRIGIKNTYQGVIDDKRVEVKKTRNSNSRRRNGRGPIKTTYRYFISINKKEHLVNHKMFKNVSTGDTVYFEITPKSNLLLFYDILDKINPPNQSPVQKSITSYPTSKIKEAPLSQRDIEIFQQKFNQKIKKK